MFSDRVARSNLAGRLHLRKDESSSLPDRLREKNIVLFYTDSYYATVGGITGPDAPKMQALPKLG